MADIKKIGDMLPQAPPKPGIKASEFFAGQKADKAAAAELAAMQKEGYREMAMAKGQQAAELAKDIVMEMTEQLAQRGVLPGHKDYAPMLKEFSGGMSEVLKNEVDPKDMKHLEVLRMAVKQLDALSKQASANRNWRSTKQGQVEEKKIVEKQAATVKQETANLKEEKVLQQHQVDGPPAVLPHVDSEDPDQTIKPRAAKKAEVAEELKLVTKQEKVQTLREHLIDLEEKQRKVYAENVADAEVQSRVMFERSNSALEELLAFSKESTEEIAEFSDNEQDVLEEIRDLLKKSRTAGPGDLSELKEMLANIKGKGSVFSEKNSSFERIFKESTKIAEKATQRVSLTSRIGEGIKGFAQDKISEVGSNLFNKLPMPLRFLVGAANFMPGSKKFGDSQRGTKFEKAQFGRGQIEAIEQLSKEEARGERSAGNDRIRMSIGGGGGGRGGKGTPFGFGGGGGAKNLRIEKLSVGNFAVDMLNIKELDNDSEFYKLLKGLGKGGGGPLGGIMDALGSILTGLGLGGLVAKGKALVGGAVRAVKGVFSAGAGAAKGMAAAGKALTKLPGALKVVGGGLLGASALAGDALLPAAKAVGDIDKAAAVTKGAFMTNKALEMAKLNPIKGPGAELVERAVNLQKLDKVVAAAGEGANVAKGVTTAAEVTKGASTVAAATKGASMLSKVGNVAGKVAGAIEVGTAGYDMYDVLSGGTSVNDWNEGNKKMDLLDYLSPWKVGKKVGAEVGAATDSALSVASGKDTSLGSWLYDKLSGSKDDDITKAVPISKRLASGKISEAMGPPSSLANDNKTLKDLAITTDSVRIATPEGIMPPSSADRSNSVLAGSKESAGKSSGGTTINNQTTVVQGGGGKSGVSDMPIPVSPARNQENAFQRYQFKTFAPY